MSQDGAKIVKVVAKRKIKNYSKDECLSELTRLANDSSKYKQDVQERLEALASN